MSQWIPGNGHRIGGCALEAQNQNKQINECKSRKKLEGKKQSMPRSKPTRKQNTFFFTTLYTEQKQNATLSAPIFHDLREVKGRHLTDC